MSEPKKSLGQHWLDDDVVLAEIVATAKVQPGEQILEIGPGRGSLTSDLLQAGAKVIAIEKDEQLADSLISNIQKRERTDPSRTSQDPRLSFEQIAKNLQIVEGDILTFDLNELPKDYKVVANIPYYLTSNLIRVLCESTNPPETITLLVQKEVAERICAKPGQMSLLSVSAQSYYDCELGIVVPAAKFTPPPKVDSQVVHMVRKRKLIFEGVDTRNFFRVVKAGFSGRRKTLLNSLSGGLDTSKDQIKEILTSCQINTNTRAQELSLEQWCSLANKINT